MHDKAWLASPTVLAAWASVIARAAGREEACGLGLERLRLGHFPERVHDVLNLRRTDPCVIRQV